MLLDPELADAVQACGYEPFRLRLPSDHRGMYIDVETLSFFGSHTQPLAPMHQRDYCSKNIHQTADFINGQAAHLQEHQWFDQIKQLEQCIAQNQPNHQLAEKLDKRRIAACRYSGKKLKHYCSVPFSRKIVKERNIHRLLMALLRSYKNPSSDVAIRESLISKLALLDVTAPLDLATCRTMVKAQLQVLRAATKAEHHTHDYRQDFLDELIQAATAKGDNEKAKAIKSIQQAEQMSRV